MKRAFSLLLTLALLLSCVLPVTAFAASEGWYEVLSKEPNGYCYLYSKPTSEDGVSQNLGRYDNGALVYLYEEEGDYSYVKTRDGKYGYIRTSSLRRYTGTVPSDRDLTGWYIVRSKEPNGYCYLYSKPSSSTGQNLGRYDNGEYVYVEEYYAGGSSQSHFCYVRTQDGKYGYIRSTCIVKYNGSVPAATPRPTAKPTARPTATPTVRPTLPSGKLGLLPDLEQQGYGNVRGGNTNVYTGPDDTYYRTTSGKAYVANGGSLRVYGKEDGYYLVQYSAILSGKTVPRWSYIPSSRFTVKEWVDTLTWDWLPITIKQSAHISDAPTWTHAYSAKDIEIVRDSAFALAKYLDSNGTYWVYFEALGYANTVSNQGYVSVRGFVPVSQVTLR